MGLFNRICQPGLRWGLLVAWVLALSAGCVRPSVSQTFPTFANPPPSDTAEAVQVRTVQSASTATLPPSEMAAAPQATSTPVNPPVEDFSHVTVTPAADIAWQMIEKVDKDRALNDLRQLAGDKPVCTDMGCYTIMNRVTGSEGLQWAKDYVSQELARLGYTVELRDWSREGKADQNLIAMKMGSLLSDQEVYFVAHLDGVKKNRKERFPAADDDASGVVDLLELARVLSNYSLSRTVVFLFSTGEEEGTLGATSYVSQLSPKALSAIQYVVNVDMIGYDENRDGAMQLWPGEHAPSRALTEVMSDTIRTYQLNLVPRIITGCD
jgi:hypothetical protein